MTVLEQIQINFLYIFVLLNTYDELTNLFR